jgi:hypothetical protein
LTSINQAPVLNYRSPQSDEGMVARADALKTNFCTSGAFFEFLNYAECKRYFMREKLQSNHFNVQKAIK